MLPHVHAKDRYLAPDDGVLVFSGNDTQALGVLDEPSPSTALESEKCLAECGLKGVDSTPGLFDGGGEGRCAAGTRVRGT